MSKNNLGHMLPHGQQDTSTNSADSVSRAMDSGRLTLSAEEWTGFRLTLSARRGRLRRDTDVVAMSSLVEQHGNNTYLLSTVL